MKPKRGNKKNSKVVKCEDCGKPFQSLSAKNQHQKSKHRGRRFICSTCNEDLASKFGLLRHMERAHKDLQPVNIDETESYVTHKVEMSEAAKDAMIDRLNMELEEKNEIIAGLKKKVQELQHLKVLRPEIGMRALNEWIKFNPVGASLFPGPNYEIEMLLNCSLEEISYVIIPFLQSIRKPDNTEYSPDTIFYLIMGIQKYLIQNGKHLNILIGHSCKGISDALDQVLSKSLDQYLKSDRILARIEEEFLWECCQLGSYSPSILLATLIYFNMKFFQMSFEDQKQLKFSDIVVFSDNHILSLKYKEKVYEKPVGTVSGFKCPVKHYQYYLHKCPEEVKSEDKELLLSPIIDCNPENAYWFTTNPMEEDEIRKIVNRSKLVKEIIVSAK